MPYQLTALDHVQLAMPAGEEENARRFYRDLLGLPEIAKPPVLAARGGVVAMRPLVIHASSKSRSQAQRRVLHIEYAAVKEFPGGLRLALA